MNFLNDFLIYDIFYFLPNEDIFKINKICVNFRNLSLNDKFFENILYRNHPIVFNLIDNYCHVCNLQIYLISNKFDYMKCNHLKFPPIKNTNKIDHINKNFN